MLWCIHGGQRKTCNCLFPLWVLRFGSGAFTCWDILNNLVSHSLSPHETCVYHVLFHYYIWLSDADPQRASQMWPHSPLAPLSSRYQWGEDRPQSDVALFFPQLPKAKSPSTVTMARSLEAAEHKTNSAIVAMVSPQTHLTPAQELFSPQT